MPYIFRPIDKVIKCLTHGIALSITDNGDLKATPVIKGVATPRAREYIKKNKALLLNVLQTYSIGQIMAEYSNGKRPADIMFREQLRAEYLTELKRNGGDELAAWAAVIGFSDIDYNWVDSE